MDATRLLPVNTDALIALDTHLRDTGSALSLAAAASLAIRAWLADNAGPIDIEPAPTAHADVVADARGYQWKTLFLPEGTDLRMSCGGEVHHARVTGDAIVYHGRRVSPRQLTLAIAGDGRNAWRDLSLRLPGEKRFQPACLLRRKVQDQIKAKAKAETGEEAPPESPVAAIAAAASAMSEALRTALVLVEHSNAQSVPKYERRVDYHRRAADVMTDHAMFD
jgi:hypothetical protein